MEIQNSLFGIQIPKEELKENIVDVVKCQVVDSGFDVINADDFKDKKDISRISHYPNKETNENIGVTKEEFEKGVKEGYKVDKVEWVEKSIIECESNNELIKPKKEKVRKATITIGLLEFDDCSELNLKKWKEDNIPIPKIKGYDVDFEGYQEGSGSPCRDNLAVEKEVAKIREKYKDKYKFEVIDKREEQQLLRDKVNDQKIIVKVKYGLDTEDKRDFFVNDNRNELGIDSCLGGCGSSAFGENMGEKEKTLEEKEVEAVEWIIKGICEDGLSRENIEVIREEMNEEDILDHKKSQKERKDRDLEFAEKDIVEYSKKLKSVKR